MGSSTRDRVQVEGEACACTQVRADEEVGVSTECTLEVRQYAHPKEHEQVANAFLEEKVFRHLAIYAPICSHKTLGSWEHRERMTVGLERQTPCEREESHTPETGTMFWVGI